MESQRPQSQTNQTLLGSKIVQDTSATNSAVDTTTGGSGTLYMVEVDNSGYTLQFILLADVADATAGTTAATMVLYCPASSKRSYVFPEGIAFSNGFSHWCVVELRQTLARQQLRQQFVMLR